MTEKVVVTGGAGYIGTHVCKNLVDNGFEPWIIDPKSNMTESVVNRFNHKSLDIDPVGLYEQQALSTLLKGLKIKTVVHLAAYIEVGESVTDPEKYYHNNICKFVNFFNLARHSGVENMVVASSAAVYGSPKAKYARLTTPCNPVNPYGRTKLIMEELLRDYNRAYGFNSVALRLFNVSGADPSGEFGEDHNPETHLIPRIIECVQQNKQFTIFGNTYDTPDGSCVRDYIHVNDVANAVLQSIWFLKQMKKDNVIECRSFNVGSGKGTSNLDIIHEIEKQLGIKVNYKMGPPREGDPASLIANIDDTKEYLEWQPIYSKLPNIIADAWKWHQKQR